MRKVLVLLLAAAAALAIVLLWGVPFESEESGGAASGEGLPRNGADREGSQSPKWQAEARRTGTGTQPHLRREPRPRPGVEVGSASRYVASSFVFDNVFAESLRRAAGTLRWAPSDSVSIHDVMRGEVDAFVCVGKSTTVPRGGQRILLGEFVVAAAVHPGNPNRALTTQQLRALLDGMSANWNRLGTFAEPVRVHGLAGVTSFEVSVRGRLGVARPGGAVRREFAGWDGVAKSLGRDPGGVALLPAAVARRHGLPTMTIDGLGPPGPGERGTLAYPLTFPVVLLVGERLGDQAASLAEQLQPMLNLHARDRSFEVRRTPRRPGRTRDQR